MAVYSTGITSENSILNVAKSMFYENGYQNSKYSELCKRAGVNHGTLVYHFGNKETIANRIYSEFFAHIFEISKSIAGNSAPLSKVMMTVYILWWDIVCEDSNIARFLREIFQAHIVQDDSIKRILDLWPEMEEEFDVCQSITTKRLHAYSLVGTDNEIMIHYLPSKEGNKEIVVYLMNILLSGFQVPPEKVDSLYNECYACVAQHHLDYSYFSHFRYTIE